MDGELLTERAAALRHDDNKNRPRIKTDQTHLGAKNKSLENSCCAARLGCRFEYKSIGKYYCLLLRLAVPFRGHQSGPSVSTSLHLLPLYTPK